MTRGEDGGEDQTQQLQRVQAAAEPLHVEVIRRELKFLVCSRLQPGIHGFNAVGVLGVEFGESVALGVLVLHELGAEPVVPLGALREVEEQRRHHGHRALLLLLHSLQPRALAQLFESLAHEDGKHRLEPEDVHEPLARGGAPGQRVIHALDRGRPAAPLALHHQQHQLQPLVLHEGFFVIRLHRRRDEGVEDVFEHLPLTLIRRVFTLERRHRAQQCVDAPELAHALLVLVRGLREDGENLGGCELVVIRGSLGADSFEEPLEELGRGSAEIGGGVHVDVRAVLHDAEHVTDRRLILRRRLAAEPLEALVDELVSAVLLDARHQRGAPLLRGLHRVCVGELVEQDEGVARDVRVIVREERQDGGHRVESAKLRVQLRVARQGAQPLDLLVEVNLGIDKLVGLVRVL